VLLKYVSFYVIIARPRVLISVLRSLSWLLFVVLLCLYNERQGCYSDSNKTAFFYIH